MENTIVDILELQKTLKVISSINKEDFNNIEWQINGRKFDISNYKRNLWNFLGLNNVDFIKYDFYKLSDDDIRKEICEAADCT